MPLASIAPTNKMAANQKSHNEKSGMESCIPHSDASKSTTVTSQREQGKTEDSHRDSRSESVMEDEIHELARRYTSESHTTPNMLFPVPADGPLDPNGSKFNARKWAKAFYALRETTTGDAPIRTSSVAFRDLGVHGYGTPTDFQKSVGNIFLEGLTVVKQLLGRQKQRIDILHGVEGVVETGEMLMVLGPPGSGCSTMLKTIAGDTHGLYTDKQSTINYKGITPEQMHTAFKGEAIYTAEVDAHFPHMTVGDTLYFAARARCPKNIPDNTSRRQYAEYLRDVTLTIFGIAHIKDTRVGDNFIRGVSGGERKRVTIAEAALSYSPLQCWDNSTRGLDSANALQFCKTLRIQADILGTTACVAIYQASQDAYEVFDKVIVLYEGRQIFFGKTTEARAYFEDLGFICPEQQTTADFLTSMTSSQERVIRHGFEGKAPRSADEFAGKWRNSQARAQLTQHIESYLERHPFNSKHYSDFLGSRTQDQSNFQRPKSPFTLSYWSQITLTLWRSWLLLKGDPSTTVTMAITNLFQALIISSIFYNLNPDTSSINQRGILIFFMVLMNAFGSILEIMTLYAKRIIVEKHARYALYHPSAEALASMISDLPYKIINCFITNVIIYFMVNLRREPGPFFFFILNIFFITLTMSMMFRLLGSLTKTIASALAPASVILLVIMLYTGFAIKVQNMQVWLGWLRWLNPAHYGFEALLLNEFHGRQFPCVSFVPQGAGYEDASGLERICSTAGSRPGEDFVDGAAYLDVSYGYVIGHKWRNFGLMIVFMLIFLAAHLVASEYVASEHSKGEVLVFSRKAMSLRNKAIAAGHDVENPSTRPKAVDQSSSDGGAVTEVEKQTSVFHWADVWYEVKVKNGTRRILDHVDGWVKPGTLTALMVCLL